MPKKVILGMPKKVYLGMPEKVYLGMPEKVYLGMPEKAWLGWPTLYNYAIRNNILTDTTCTLGEIVHITEVKAMPVCVDKVKEQCDSNWILMKT